MSAVVPVRADARGGAPSLLECEVDAALDPLELVERLSDGTDFYLERPSEGLAVAGVGRLAGEASADDARAVRVGGFAFDRAAPPAGVWACFPTVAWSTPRLALVRRCGRSRLVAAATAGEGGMVRAEALLELGRRALAPSGVEARPAESVGYHLESIGSAAAWRDSVTATLADIEAGRLTKLVLARAVRVIADVCWSRFRVVRRLRAADPDSATFLVGWGGKAFVGSTPERLARVEGRRLVTAAVAGTAAPASDGGAEDAAFLANDKERREHAVVVDEVIRGLADLTEEIEVPETPSVLSTRTLRHLHTPVSARLRAGVDLPAVCDALHPTPAVCGLPRALCLSTLRAREEMDRGWYAGGVGWSDEQGGEVVVPLRAGLLDGRRATLFAGAGIVRGSTWEAELEETRLKMRVMQAALLEL